MLARAILVGDDTTEYQLQSTPSCHESFASAQVSIVRQATAARLAQHDWLNFVVFSGQDWAMDGFNATLERERLLRFEILGISVWL